MDLNVNDFSFDSGKSLENCWEPVVCFMELVRFLGRFGVDKIAFGQSYNHIKIAGYDLSRCFEGNDCRPLSALQFRSLREFALKHFDFKTPVSSSNRFLLEPNSNHSSVLLADAIAKDFPVVSFSFDVQFKSSALKGYLKEKEKKHLTTISVKNLFAKDERRTVSLLPSFLSTKAKDPMLEPMWNQEFINRYLVHIGHKSHKPSRALSGGEKIAYIKEHGTIIAELCGWQYHQTISKKNSKRTLRYIFYSDRFKNTTTYLSLDLEKADFHFELCDHFGHHLREICWDGTITGPARKDHDILV